MDFKLADEQKMLREGAERYLRENYSFEQRAALLKSGTGFSAAQWTQFASMGWLALAIPEDCGGLAGSFVDVCILQEALGRALVVEPFASTAILAAFLVEGCQDVTLRRSTLEAVASGDVRIALAQSEIDSRYDLRSGKTRARRTASGYCVTGQKTGVWDFPSCDQLIVTAALEGESDSSLWLVAKTAPGVQHNSYRLIDATHAADVSFKDAPAALLIPAPAASSRLDHAVDRLSLARVAESLGIMEVILELTAEQLKNRSQFGQALGKFQALQHRMAEMFVEVQEVRSILYCGLAYLDSEAEERGRVVSMAKTVATSAGRIVGAQGIQLHGGVGMTEEYPVGHYFKRLLSLEKQYGDDDYHLKRIARRYGEQTAG